jgi:hypothetical protein
MKHTLGERSIPSSLKLSWDSALASKCRNLFLSLLIFLTRNLSVNNMAYTTQTYSLEQEEKSTSRIEINLQKDITSNSLFPTTMSLKISI